MLCDPLSPMPPTPQYVHVDEEEEEEMEIILAQAPAKSVEKPLATGDRRRGQLNKVLENLKRTAENQAALNLGSNGANSGPLSSSSTAQGSSGRRKMTETPKKAEPREEPAEPEIVNPTSYDESAYSIFDAESDPLNLKEYSSREERQVDSSAVDESSDVDADLVQRVRKALEQQSLAEERPGGSTPRIGRPDSVTSTPRQTSGSVSRLSNCPPSSSTGT
jgi:hypothetical protein